MISISCTNCKSLLTIDEAFAGGVCRCQHCGTIQTVPSTARGHDSSVVGGAISGQSLGGSKVAMPRQAPGTGLEDLADIVASSGLAGSGLTSRRLSRSSGATATAAPAAKPSKLVPMIAVGSVVGVALIGTILIFALRGDSTTGTPTETTVVAGDGTTVTIPTVRGPSFAGVALEGSTVIFVLDRGSGSREIFDLMKTATVRSIATLGESRKFQVIFWDNGMEDLIFPATGPTYATTKKVDEVRKLFDETGAHGATDPIPSLEKAYAQSPDAVVLATGKGPDLPDDVATAAVAAANGIRTYAFSLGEGGSEVLKKIAAGTSAEYKHLTPAQLDAFTR